MNVINKLWIIVKINYYVKETEQLKKGLISVIHVIKIIKIRMKKKNDNFNFIFFLMFLIMLIIKP